MIGEVFGKLTVKYLQDCGKYLCECSCGGVRTVRKDRLKLYTDCGSDIHKVDKLVNNLYANG